MLLQVVKTEKGSEDSPLRNTTVDGVTSKKRCTKKISFMIQVKTFLFPFNVTPRPAKPRPAKKHIFT